MNSGLSGLTGINSPFSPADIPGFFAEFNPSLSLATGNMWQDLGETTLATTHNHPVRVIRCPRSGIKWTAPSDAARGLLQINFPYVFIKLDGTNDVYRTTNIPSVTSGFTCAARFTQITRSGYINGLAGIFSLYNNDSENSVIFRVASTVLEAGGASAVSGGTINLNTWYSGIATYSPSTAFVYLNNLQTATGTVNVVQGISQPAIGGDFMFSPRYLNGNIANIILFTSVLSDSNRNLVNSYLNGLAI